MSEMWQSVVYDRGEKVEVAAWFDPRTTRDKRLICMKVRWNGEVRLIKHFDFHHMKVEDGELCHIFDVADSTHHYVFCLKSVSLVWMLKKVEPLD